MRVPRTLATAVAGSFLAASLGADQSADPRQEVEKVLQAMTLSAAEIASIQNGTVVAHADTGPAASGEILTQAAVKIRARHDQVLSYYGQMIAYVDGEVTLGFGRFSSPAVAADVANLSFDRDEIDALKSCKVGKCDIRLGGTGITALQSAVDWNAADYPDRVNAFARKSALDYVTAYRARGDEALVTFNDRSQPVSLKKEWTGILGSSSNFQAMVPGLARYLAGYPNEQLPGARDVLYWIKENYGLKPVISIVHGVIYTPPGQTDRTLVAQKYIYASHYYDASLALGSIVSGTENGAPVSYLVYSNRSRGDLLRGGFGGLSRATARSQAKKAAEGTLATIKQVLEKGATP